MFPAAMFGPRMFGPRMFAKVGATPAPPGTPYGIGWKGVDPGVRWFGNDPDIIGSAAQVVASPGG